MKTLHHLVKIVGWSLALFKSRQGDSCTSPQAHLDREREYMKVYTYVCICYDLDIS